MSKASLQERREYLKTRVNPILEVMVADLMKERPDNVVRITNTFFYPGIFFRDIEGYF